MCIRESEKVLFPPKVPLPSVTPLKINWPYFNGKLWQRNYYEHIIRNEEEMDRIRQYIVDNPARWAEDENNPVNVTNGGVALCGRPWQSRPGNHIGLPLRKPYE